MRAQLLSLVPTGLPYGRHGLGVFVLGFPERYRTYFHCDAMVIC